MNRDAYWRKAKVLRVIDGDTVDLEVDLGYRLSTEQRIRLLGVDAPEMHGEERGAGLASKAYVQGWVELHRHQLTQWPFVLRTEKSDAFDRWLGVLECLEGHVLNEDLLSNGQAGLWVGRNA